MGNNKPYKMTRAVAHAAVALAAIAYQANPKEVAVMEQILQEEGGVEKWWQAVDGMTLERCRRARKEWSWTCDMHAQVSASGGEGGQGSQSTNNGTVHEDMLLEHALEASG